MRNAGCLGQGIACYAQLDAHVALREIPCRRQEALYSRIRVVFKEGEPKTGESYWVTVQTRETSSGTPTNVDTWIKIGRTATTRGDGNKEILISTADPPPSGQPKWPGVGEAAA